MKASILFVIEFISVHSLAGCLFYRGYEERYGRLLRNFRYLLSSCGGIKSKKKKRHLNKCVVAETDLQGANLLHLVTA